MKTLDSIFTWIDRVAGVIIVAGFIAMVCGMSSCTDAQAQDTRREITTVSTLSGDTITLITKRPVVIDGCYSSKYLGVSGSDTLRVIRK